MKGKKGLFCSTVLIVLMVVTSCAPTTKLTSLWRDDRYDKPLNNVMVIGVAKRPASRRIFEREFTYQFKERGVNAVPSFQVLPSEEMLEKETIVSKIKEMDIDTVLITSLTDQKVVSTQVRYYQRYASSYKEVYKDKLVSLETNLFDAKTEKLIWAATSDTFLKDGANVNNEIRNLVNIMIKQLSDDGLLK
ncbi:hypothetical protein EP227_06475 [bacterium]|nr:MAG: hypothetical protein EP227_06475 [bacterium]